MSVPVGRRKFNVLSNTHLSRLLVQGVRRLHILEQQFEPRLCLPVDVHQIGTVMGRVAFIPTGRANPQLTVGAEKHRRQLVLIADTNVALHPLFSRNRAQLMLGKDLPDAMDLAETILAQSSITLLAVVARTRHITLQALHILVFLKGNGISRGRRTSDDCCQTRNLMLTLVDEPQHLVAVMKLFVDPTLRIQRRTDVADPTNRGANRRMHLVYDASFTHQMVTSQNERPAGNALLDVARGERLVALGTLWCRTPGQGLVRMNQILHVVRRHGSHSRQTLPIPTCLSLTTDTDDDPRSRSRVSNL